MRIKFKVSYVDVATKVVTLYPIECPSLAGYVTYHPPGRNVERFNLNDVVEFIGELPGLYPDKYGYWDDDRKYSSKACLSPNKYREKFGEYPVADNIRRIAGMIAQDSYQTNLADFAEQLKICAEEIGRTIGQHTPAA